MPETIRPGFRAKRSRREPLAQVPQKQGEGFWVAQGGERLSWEARRTLGHFAGGCRPGLSKRAAVPIPLLKTAPKERNLALFGDNDII
jgi:hypothetical protein